MLPARQPAGDTHATGCSPQLSVASDFARLRACSRQSCAIGPIVQILMVMMATGSCQSGISIGSTLSNVRCG